MSGGTYKRQIFEKLFHGNIFSYFRFDVVAFTSNKPTHYLLDYSEWIKHILLIANDCCTKVLQIFKKKFQILTYIYIEFILIYKYAAEK